MKLVHLARRFFASVFARSPGPEEAAWVQSLLMEGEFELWASQPRYDRRHTLGVARRVERALAERTEPRWLAAALLHDIGKLEASLGITGRVLATLTMGMVGRARVCAWSDRSGWRGRFGRYADHGEIGATMIESAGGRAEAARWAAVHHRIKRADPGIGFDLPREVVLVLRDSDRD